ncbi:16S rRNA (guanine(966)-N(2))-methyltransferase RsmD [Desulfuromonas thiophila]|uniref:16S rRNA (Guanine966-N2)-methyltransferase n=1 Tax=Desulfuromonas thiophila TaxID=57664 RepID=A0A1G7AHD3_9BACT|nr:16S rRNA (guanine(966)-N(2))-methyltransferase RsmD [Desulfuromonas thiophila]SDE14338.1 16S rRNA (guanine966-N2)-methyltransferase [Desulfuromonas thiophila]
MRIIAGQARGRQLADFSGRAIRPTSDRVREALFSILLSRLGSFEGLRVLDLFAGSGALALESLSRGACEAVLIDAAPAAARLIRQNAARCGLTERCQLVTRSLPEALMPLQGRRFDLIFIDPPYGQNLLPPLLQRIDQLQLLTPGGLLCAEEGRQSLPDERYGDLHLLLRRIYGQTAIHLYQPSLAAISSRGEPS